MGIFIYIYIGGWCISKGHCECSMSECYGPNKISCEDRMCHGLYEIVFNEHNCRSGPKYKTTALLLHCFGFLFGLGNFYSGHYYIGAIQLMQGLVTIYSYLAREYRGGLTFTALVWLIVELGVTFADYKVDGAGCPLYIQL